MQFKRTRRHWHFRGYSEVFGVSKYAALKFNGRVWVGLTGAAVYVAEAAILLRCCGTLLDIVLVGERKLLQQAVKQH